MSHSLLTSHNPAAIAEIPGLYISDITVPSSPTQLSSLGITHILSLMSTSARPTIPAHLNIVHKRIEVEDDAFTDLLAVLDDAITFIDAALTHGDGDGEKKVLVHCLQGISRSGAITVAYTMQTLKLSYREALDLARKYRPIVTPNPGFKAQLEVWAGMGYCVRDGDGVEKKAYEEWKDKRKRVVERGEEEVGRERARGLAGVVARIGGVRARKGEVEGEGDGDEGVK